MGCGECLTGCARVLLIIFNFVFWLSGAAILGIGIWFLVDKNIQTNLDLIQVEGEAQLIKYAAYIFIAFGTFVFLVGFCGCCGAIRDSECLLGFYIFFLIVIFAGELAAGIVVAIYRNDLTAKLESELQRKVKYEYGESNKMHITDAIDRMQISLGCCGGSNAKDYENSKWVNGTNPSKMLPVSCCVLEDKDINNVINKDDCQSKQGSYHTNGCKDKLLDWMKSHTNILIGIGCGIAGIQLFGLIFAIALCRKVRTEEKY